MAKGLQKIILFIAILSLNGAFFGCKDQQGSSHGTPKSQSLNPVEIARLIEPKKTDKIQTVSSVSLTRIPEFFKDCLENNITNYIQHAHQIDLKQQKKLFSEYLQNATDEFARNNPGLLNGSLEQSYIDQITYSSLAWKNPLFPEIWKDFREIYDYFCSKVLARVSDKFVPELPEDLKALHHEAFHSGKLYLKLLRRERDNVFILLMGEGHTQPEDAAHFGKEVISRFSHIGIEGYTVKNSWFGKFGNALEEKATGDFQYFVDSPATEIASSNTLLKEKFTMLKPDAGSNIYSASKMVEESEGTSQKMYLTHLEHDIQIDLVQNLGLTAEVFRILGSGLFSAAVLNGIYYLMSSGLFPLILPKDDLFTVPLLNSIFKILFLEKISLIPYCALTYFTVPPSFITFYQNMKLLNIRIAEYLDQKGYKKTADVLDVRRVFRRNEWKIDKRNEAMAKKLIQMADNLRPTEDPKSNRILAIVGANHVNGMTELLEAQGFQEVY